LPVYKGGYGDDNDEKRGQGKQRIKRQRSTEPRGSIIDPFAYRLFEQPQPLLEMQAGEFTDVPKDFMAGVWFRER
jgi:hypothetical protein